MFTRYEYWIFYYDIAKMCPEGQMQPAGMLGADRSINSKIIAVWVAALFSKSSQRGPRKISNVAHRVIVRRERMFRYFKRFYEHGAHWWVDGTNNEKTKANRGFIFYII